MGNGANLQRLSQQQEQAAKVKHHFLLSMSQCEQMTTADEASDLHRIAQKVCERLAIGQVLEILPLHQGYENFNCRILTTEGEFVLRQYLEQSHDRIANELKVLRWLMDLGFPAVAPLSLRDQRDEAIFPDPTGERPWVVFPFVHGEEPEATPTTAAAAGNAMGRLHALPDPNWDGWNIENPLSPATTVAIVESVEARRPEHCAHLVSRFACVIEEIIPNVQPLDLPSGLVHGDLFPDNTLFQGDSLVAVLDFGQVCRDEYLFDVAMALHGFCIGRNNKIEADSFRALILAYQSQRNLTGEEIEALPLYLRWCPLTMAAWHYARFAAKPNERQGTRICELLDLGETDYPVADYFL